MNLYLDYNAACNLNRFYHEGKSSMTFIFDGHNDTLTAIFNPDTRKGRSFFEESSIGHIDLPRARQAGFRGGFFAIFTRPPADSPERDPMYGITFTDDGYSLSERSPLDPTYVRQFTDEVITFAHQLEANSNGQVKIIRNVDELEHALNHDMLSMVLALEGAEAINADLSNLEDYYYKGIRSIGLVWSRPNAFGYGVPFRFPASPDIGPGLTSAGKNLVRACNQLGILIDLAHLNEQGFRDVAELSTAPLVVTHADVYSICPSTRNLIDAQIDAVAQSGGVIGINFEAMNTHPRSSIEQAVPLTQITAHIDYIVNRIGIDHVTFGSDFDGADMPNDLSDVRGLPKLITTLRNSGYDESALEKITYKNWLRVIKATWKSTG
jgi:membrane dipeptidase